MNLGHICMYSACIQIYIINFIKFYLSLITQGTNDDLDPFLADLWIFFTFR